MPVPRKSFALRLDPALYATLERLAATDLRSVNAQIEVLLREALKARGAATPSLTPSLTSDKAEADT